ncbi:MAG: M1 family aminopeptidase [Balneolaceae bacterium]|nr:M1 family aminopeptidase [Balneolaceae bacterium]
MKKYILLLFLFLQPAGEVSADDYPKNPNIDIRHYSFSITLSDGSNIIAGETTITVAFKKESIPQMRLDLINKTEHLDGKGMSVTSVSSHERALTYNHQNDALIIHFPDSFARKSTIQLTIKYSGIPADGLRIGPTKYGNRSFFSNNWPNRARHWLPVLDHPHEKATCEFKITAPTHYQVISNGLLQEESNLVNGHKFTHWKQSVPIPSWLYVLGVAEFAVQHLDEFMGIPVQSWVYPQDREEGFRDFATPTHHSLRFFSDYIGPYTYEKYANVQSPSVGGGMEAATAVFYNENAITGDQTTRLHNVIVHEIAHHWFGNAVTESTWDDAWLSEGFATYFTKMFREHAFGWDDFQQEMHSARDRVLEYYMDNPGYKIISDRSPETESVTSLATYQKGAWVLHMLRNRVGNRAFQQGIQSYYKHYLNSTASTSDFRIEMEQASGDDLEPFFRQWLYQGGNPELRGTWSYNPQQSTITVQMEQVQAENFQFAIPIEFGIYTQKQLLPNVTTVHMDQQSQELTIPVDGEPDSVVIDPNTKLLAKWNFSKQ